MLKKGLFTILFFLLLLNVQVNNLVIAEVIDWSLYYNNSNVKEPILPLHKRSIPKIGDGQDWIGQFVCTEDKSISPKDAQSAGFIQSPYAGEDKFVSDGEGWCYSTEEIGAIYNYDKFVYKVLEYCPPGTAVGRKGDAPLEYIKKDFELELENFRSHVCCPIEKPYEYTGFFQDRYCCSQPGLDVTGGKCSEVEDGVRAVSYKQAQLLSLWHLFSEATPKFTCGIQDCFFQGNGPAEGIRRGPYTKEEIASLNIQCFPDASAGDFNDDGSFKTFTAGNNTYYCVAGDALTPEEYLSWKDQLNAYRGCKAFGNNTSEFNNCTSCLRQCIDCVYSSLGCVNPSMNGIISTIMRIALGILGTVAIVRIMQAAILRQSGDPKDIQESWDIIMSVIIGAVVLVSATLLLRVIGINVLGILPYDF